MPEQSTTRLDSSNKHESQPLSYTLVSIIWSMMGSYFFFAAYDQKDMHPTYGLW